MAELTTQERLQPSLLDRLTDARPDRKEESRDQRVISASQLRQYVTRDIVWLLNCVNLDGDDALQDCPEAAQSTINFGIPDLSGAVLEGVDAADLQRRLRDALTAFEPRLDPAAMNVVVEVDPDRMDQRSLRFRIEAEMWAHPLPLNLYLKTEVDLDTGSVRVAEGGA